VYRYDNRRIVTVRNLPAPDDIREPGQDYRDERDRFLGELSDVRNQILIDEETTRLLNDTNSQRTIWGSQYNQIQSEHANYRSAHDVKSLLDETEQSLRALRPPVAPAADLEKERRAITLESRQNMLLVQFSLFLIVLSFIAYITLSREVAHGITFLLLCVGIATGFFLRR
jgi:hypothetical protein